MDITVADIGPDASALCSDIYARAVRDGAGAHYTRAERRAWVGPQAEPPWMADRLAAGQGWMARDGPTPLGFLVAADLEARSDIPVHLDLFFVLPEGRGRGLAPALYDRFAAAASGRPLHSFASLDLRPFLERRGWHVVRSDPQPRPDPESGAHQLLMRFIMEHAPS